MQQTVPVNFMKQDRKFTNGPFIAVFSLIFFIWLGVVIKVSGDDLLKSLEDVKKDHPTAFSVIELLNLRFTWKFPLCTILSGLIALFYTYFLSLSVGKTIIYVSVYFICIFMLLFLTLTAGIMMRAIFEFAVANLFFIFLLWCSAYLVISFRSAYNVGHKAIYEIIRDSCRAVICRPSVLLFACALSVIIVLIAVFTVFFSNFILYQYSDLTTVIYTILNLYGATALMNLFTNFIHIVISGYVIDWFTSREQHSGSLTVGRSIERTLRFHLGAVAFASIPLLSHISSIFQACKCRNRNNDIVKKYNFFTRFFSQVCVFSNIVDFALIQTSIYGYDYSTAIVAAHDLVSQNNHELNLAVSAVCFVVAAIGSSLISIPFIMYEIQYSIYSALIPFHIVFTTAVRAILVNKMIIENASEASQQDHNSAEQGVLPLQSQSGA